MPRLWMYSLLPLSSRLVEYFQDRAAAMVYCEKHGREAWDVEVDVAETGGWFNALVPRNIGSSIPRLSRRQCSGSGSVERRF